MKKTLIKLFAALAITSPLTVPATAYADNGYACTVFMCMASTNPSWGSIAACKAPMKKLMRDLARGKSFPVCQMEGGNNGSYIQEKRDYYDLCPEGMMTITSSISGNGSSSDVYYYIGTKKSSCRQAFGSRCYDLSKKAFRAGNNRLCVKGLEGTWNTGTDEAGYQSHYVYKEIIILPPHRTNRAFDVYVDNKLRQRVFLDF